MGEASDRPPHCVRRSAVLLNSARWHHGASGSLSTVDVKFLAGECGRLVGKHHIIGEELCSLIYTVSCPWCSFLCVASPFVEVSLLCCLLAFWLLFFFSWTLRCLASRNSSRCLVYCPTPGSWEERSPEKPYRLVFVLQLPQDFSSLATIKGSCPALSQNPFSYSSSQ